MSSDPNYSLSLKVVVTVTKIPRDITCLSRIGQLVLETESRFKLYKNVAK